MNYINFALRKTHTVAVAQLVRASDCGSEGRGFETPQSPILEMVSTLGTIFFFILKA